jgi:hypothetical protein
MATHLSDTMESSDDTLRTLIIGPPESGKTALVCMLKHATLQPPEFNDHPDYKVFELPGSKPTHALFQLATDTIFKGKLPIIATQGVSQYDFSLEKRTSSESGLRNRIIPRRAPPQNQIHYFRLFDGPGGAIFNMPGGDGADRDMAAEQVYRDLLIKEGRQSQGLIVCADGNNNNQIGALLKGLDDFMFEIGRPLPFRRVAIVLTKADKSFTDKGPLAQEEILHTSPIKHMKTILGDHVLQLCLNWLDSSPQLTVVCGWTSVYGFVHNQGCPNYDCENDQLLVYDRDNQRCIDHWHPFRVLDPFVFMATGNPGKMECIFKR